MLCSNSPEVSEWEANLINKKNVSRQTTVYITFMFSLHTLNSSLTFSKKRTDDAGIIIILSFITDFKTKKWFIRIVKTKR